MSIVINNFEKHPLHSTLTEVQASLSGVNIGPLKSQHDVFSYFERLNEVVELVKSRIEKSEPNLVSLTVLNNLNASFRTLLQQLNAFNSDKNVNRFATINEYVDIILSQLANIVVLTKPSDFESIRDAAISYRRSIGQLLRSIEDDSSTTKDKVGSLAKDLVKLTNEVASQKQRIDSVITEYQKQFSSGEEKRRTEFQSAESERQKKALELIAKTDIELTNYAMDKKKELGAFIEQKKEELQNLNTRFDREGKALMSSIANEKQKAIELVGLITDTGMVSGYQRVANEERDSAKNWRKVALSSLVALVGFAIFAFVETLGKEIRWDQFATRIFVAASFGILAAYSALQADKHERAERKNRKNELELASIIPYLHGLPAEKQHKIREELAMKMFGQTEAEPVNIDKRTTGSILDVLKLAIESINNLSKK